MDICLSVTCECVNECYRSGQLRYKITKVEMLNFEQREAKCKRGNCKTKLLKCHKWGAEKRGSALCKVKRNWEYYTSNIEMRKESGEKMTIRDFYLENQTHEKKWEL